MPQFYVYILASRSRSLYVGVTNHLVRRVNEHREGTGSAFTCKYKINRLVYYEAFPDIRDAITREKQVKGWLRSRKIALIATMNPDWEDLSIHLT